MALVLGLGGGIFTLGFLWTLCILLCLALARAEGPLAFGAAGVILLAIIITIILIFLPLTTPEDVRADIKDVTKYDDTIVGRTAIVAITGIFLLVGLGAYAVFDVMEPIYAKPLKKH